MPFAVYLLVTEIADQENDDLEESLKFQFKFNVDADNDPLDICGSAGADSTQRGLISTWRLVSGWFCLSVRKVSSIQAPKRFAMI